jgi:hypothetical protein
MNNVNYNFLTLPNFLIGNLGGCKLFLNSVTLVKKN